MRIRGKSAWFCVLAIAGVLGAMLVPLPAQAAIGGSFSVNDVKVYENNGTATFTISRALGVGTGTVNITTSSVNAKRNIDFTPLTITLTFGATEASKLIRVTLLQDDLDEKDETFKVNLSGATGSTIADATGIGTIVDDDPSPTVSVLDASVIEGNAGTTAMLFTVKLDKVSGQNVRVRYRAVNGTATIANNDFGEIRGGMTVAAGNPSGVITVTINGDKVKELNETLTLELSSPVEAVIGDATAIGTIKNDD